MKNTKQSCTKNSVHVKYCNSEVYGWCKVGKLSLRAKREVSFALHERDFSAQKARLEMTSRDCQGTLHQPYSEVGTPSSSFFVLAKTRRKLLSPERVRRRVQQLVRQCCCQRIERLLLLWRKVHARQHLGHFLTANLLRLRAQ
jgi:hypothetical protein